MSTSMSLKGERDGLDVFGMALLMMGRREDGPTALIITGQDKFFSNGLDTDSLLNVADPTEYIRAYQAVLARLLCLNVPYEGQPDQGVSLIRT